MSDKPANLSGQVGSSLARLVRAVAGRHVTRGKDATTQFARISRSVRGVADDPTQVLQCLCVCHRYKHLSITRAHAQLCINHLLQ